MALFIAVIHNDYHDVENDYNGNFCSLNFAKSFFSPSISGSYYSILEPRKRQRLPVGTHEMQMSRGAILAALN